MVGSSVVRLAPQLPGRLSATLSQWVLLSGILNPAALLGLSGPGSLAGLFKLHQIEQQTAQILQVATGTMALSGLNLAVSAIGFAVIAARLNAIEQTLQAMQQDVKAVRALLERSERAKFANALADLTNANRIRTETNRRAILIDARNIFGVALASYRELLQGAEDGPSGEGAAEFAMLTLLARSRCSAELGELELAQHELATGCGELADRYSPSCS